MIEEEERETIKIDQAQNLNQLQNQNLLDPVRSPDLSPLIQGDLLYFLSQFSKYKKMKEFETKKRLKYIL